MFRILIQKIIAEFFGFLTRGTCAVKGFDDQKSDDFSVSELSCLASKTILIDSLF